jgi:hypothetical protein
LARIAIGLSSFVGKVLGGTIAPVTSDVGGDNLELAVPGLDRRGESLLLCLADLAIPEAPPAGVHSLPGAAIEIAAPIVNCGKDGRRFFVL